MVMGCCLTVNSGEDTPETRNGKSASEAGADLQSGRARKANEGREEARSRVSGPLEPIVGQLGFVTKPEVIHYVTSLIPYKYPGGILIQIYLLPNSLFSFMDML